MEIKRKALATSYNLSQIGNGLNQFMTRWISKSTQLVVVALFGIIEIWRRSVQRTHGQLSHAFTSQNAFEIKELNSVFDATPA